MDNSTQSATIPDLQILPNGCFNIFLLIGKGVLAAFKNKQYNFNQGIYLCSQVTKPVKATLLAHTKVILIQINPWYFSYYPENDLSKFIDDVSRSESNKQLFDKNIDLNSPSILEEIIDLTENHFLHFGKKHPKKNIIERITSEILLRKGDCKISNILENYNYSERWIQLQFKKATGLSPKQFSKIIQFRDSVDKIVYESAQESLTSIGYEAGFNDQSHFIKNFRHFLGTTPSKFNPKNFVLSFKE